MPRSPQENIERDDRCPARTVSRSKDGRLEFAAVGVFSASLALPTADGKNPQPSGVPSTNEVVKLLIFGCRVSANTKEIYRSTRTSTFTL